MAGLFAKGTAIWIGDGASPETFTKVSNVKSINGPGFQVTIVDTTTHSTVGFYREKAAVLIDPGKLSFGVNFDPQDPTLAPATGLFNLMANLTERNMQLRFPPSDVGNHMMEFLGFVTGHPFSFPVDNVIEGNIEITLDGPVNWTTYVP
jgi:hypothetical protein